MTSSRRSVELAYRPLTSSDMTITCDVYVNGLRQPERRTLAEAVPTVAIEGGFVWVDLERPSAGELAEVTAQLGLPDAVVQDSLKTHARPDLQDHVDLAVIVLKAIRYLSQDDRGIERGLRSARIDVRDHGPAGRQVRIHGGSGAARPTP